MPNEKQISRAADFCARNGITDPDQMLSRLGRIMLEDVLEARKAEIAQGVLGEVWDRCRA